MRNFVLGAQDVVRIDRVLTAHRRCLVAEEPAVREMERAFSEIGEGIGDNVDAFEDILYGDLLDGEYERHQRNLERKQEEKDLAVWLVGESAEFLVRNVRTNIVVAAREGLLNVESTRAVNAVHGSTRAV